MSHRVCGQVNIPTTDDSSPCTDFQLSQCVIVDRISPLLHNVEGGNLNDYHILMENRVRRLELEIKLLKNIIKHISSQLPEVGIGIYDEEDQDDGE